VVQLNINDEAVRSMNVIKQRTGGTRSHRHDVAARCCIKKKLPHEVLLTAIT
jgi:hypothetical protein